MKKVIAVGMVQTLTPGIRLKDVLEVVSHETPWCHITVINDQEEDN